MTELRYEVMVHDGLPRHREQRLPDGGPIVSSPVASTLIFGQQDAVLVDPPFTRDQVQRVGDWIEDSGKTLTHIYATHGHGDHWFGTDLLLQRFPGAIPYATDATIAKMHQQATEGRAQMWDVDFPGQIPPSPVVYQPVPADGIELEGHRLLAVEAGHTNTDDTTVLHVPSIGLVVAGDVTYNGVHQYPLESAHGGVEAWLAALDKVEALRPRAVVAGHKNKDLPVEPAVVAFLQQMQSRLHGEGYAYTAVPDQTVTVFHHNGAAVEVIWSRRRTNGTEIERLAVHVEVARGPAGWRIIAIQAAPTTSDSLNTAWPQAS